MRRRRRYIAFESVDETKIQDVLRTVGSLRASRPKLEQPNLKLVLYNENSRRGLIRCGHTQVEEIKASMPFFRVLGVSGTIRAAKRKFLVSSQAKG